MAEQFILPFTLRLLPVPRDGPPEWIAWAQQTNNILIDEYQVLRERIETLLTVGVIADRPAAAGTFVFYFSTDEAPNVLYFDDGAWNAV